jgi:4a-hydroxytetrahydrobiopterin dehydratase
MFQRPYNAVEGAMKLSPSEIDERLSTLPGWSRQGDVLTRQFTFKGFPDAIAFVTRLAFDAQAADHHPDLQVNFRRVTVGWSTHDEGGITEKDFSGAAQADAAAKSFPA